MIISKISITVLTVDGPVNFDQEFASAFKCKSVSSMLDVYRVVTGCSKRKTCITKFNGMNNVLRNPTEEQTKVG